MKQKKIAERKMEGNEFQMKRERRIRSETVEITRHFFINLIIEFETALIEN